MEAVTLSSHMVKGLGGIVAIIERAIEDGLEFPPGHIDEIDKQAGVLDELVKLLREPKDT